MKGNPTASHSMAGNYYTTEQAQRVVLLVEWLATKRLQTITPRQVCQLGPSALRRAALAKEALECLADHGYLDPDPYARGCVYDVDRRIWDR